MHIGYIFGLYQLEWHIIHSWDKGKKA